MTRAHNSPNLSQEMRAEVSQVVGTLMVISMVYQSEEKGEDSAAQLASARKLGTYFTTKLGITPKDLSSAVCTKFQAHGSAATVKCFANDKAAFGVSDWKLSVASLTRVGLYRHRAA